MKKIVWMLMLAVASFAEVKLNAKAPAFTAVDQDGNAWSLNDRESGKFLVLYFYPAAMTGGCTKQACSYRDYVESTPDRNIEVIGVSGDAPENLKHFQQAEGLNFRLLSDPDGAIAKVFGVPVREGEKTITRTVSGKEVELTRTATTARWTFIIDPAGHVVYRDNQVKATQDLERVLQFIE